MNEKILKKCSETNWEHLKTISDEEIDTSDIPALDENFFAGAKLRVPKGKVSVLLNVDEEIADWYKKQGSDFQNLVNTALRDYAESHR
ncbi:MAG: BrnA antitoxin family protein [Pyrinomonadaceae bacterium]